MITRMLGVSNGMHCTLHSVHTFVFHSLIIITDGRFTLCHILVKNIFDICEFFLFRNDFPHHLTFILEYIMNSSS